MSIQFTLYACIRYHSNTHLRLKLSCQIAYLHISTRQPSARRLVNNGEFEGCFIVTIESP